MFKIKLYFLSEKILHIKCSQCLSSALAVAGRVWIYRSNTRSEMDVVLGICVCLSKAFLIGIWTRWYRAWPSFIFFWIFTADDVAVLECPFLPCLVFWQRFFTTICNSIYCCRTLSKTTNLLDNKTEKDFSVKDRDFQRKSWY